MAAITRLVSTADVHDGSQSHTVSASVLFEAELDNGQSVLLLDDRGWNSSQPWAQASQDEIEATARTVVGPDEPYGDQTMADSTTAHWNYLRNILAQHGVETTVEVLRGVPHEVVLSQQVLERLGNGDSAAE